MDPKLLDKSETSDNPMPQFNWTVIDGFHQREFDQIERIYNQRLELILEPLKSRGVVYRGTRSVRPDEYFKSLTENSKAKTFETNKESLYPVSLAFDILDSKGNATTIDKIYQMLPFTDRYGDVFIRGSQYSLQIVMGDRGLTATRDEKIMVKTLGYCFRSSSETVELKRIFHENDLIHYQTIPVNLSSNRFYSATAAFKLSPGSPVPNPLLAWYMFAYMGFSGVMKRFAECEYLVGETDALIADCPAKDGWYIYTARGTRNKGDKFFTPYVELNYAIAVRSIDPKRRDEEIQTVAIQYLGALIYLFDTGPGLVDLERLDDPRYWMYIIGRCSMTTKASDDSIMKRMDDHFDSLNDKLDDLTIKRFASQNIKVRGMFELFNHIISCRAEFVKTFDRGLMFNKELCSLEYTMEVLTSSATRFKFDIKNTTDLTEAKIRKSLTSYFRPRAIEQAAWTSNLVQESTPTDCPLVDYTLGVIQQRKLISGNGIGRGGNDFNPHDAACSINYSLPFVMSSERVTQPNPDGRGYLLPCVHVTPQNVTYCAPYLIPLCDTTKERLTIRETDYVPTDKS